MEGILAYLMQKNSVGGSKNIPLTEDGIMYSDIPPECWITFLFFTVIPLAFASVTAAPADAAPVEYTAPADAAIMDSYTFTATQACGCCFQGEGMGLLLYKTMISLRDVAHNGFCVHHYVIAAGNSITSQLGSSRQGT